jgi:hypothetical protein
MRDEIAFRVLVIAAGTLSVVATAVLLFMK